MTSPTYPIPTPAGPCPPADNPEAILLWLYLRQQGTGRLSRCPERDDPFWRRIDEKRRDRARLASSLLADPRREDRIARIAAYLGVQLAGLDAHGRVEAVADALVPLRFHISAALAELGELERAAEVLVGTY